MEAVTVNHVPDGLMPSGPEWRSRFCDEVMARKAEVFPITRGSGTKYIHVPSLKKWMDTCRRQSESNYRKYRGQDSAVKQDKTFTQTK